MKPLKSRRSSGFALMELAVTVVVAGVALASTAGAVSEGARLSRTTAETRVAIRSSQTMIERVRATRYADVPSAFDGRTWPMLGVGGGNSTGTCSVSVQTVDTGHVAWPVWKITVNTNWIGATGATQKSFVTYVGNRSGGTALDPTTILMADTGTGTGNGNLRSRNNGGGNN